MCIRDSADVGSIAGGWLSSTLLKRGWELTRARKTAMLVFACTVLAIAFVPFTGGSLWLTVILVGIAAGSHQGWSANLFTIGSDCFPRKTVGSIVGFGGLGGAVGGALVQPAVGKWLDLDVYKRQPQSRPLAMPYSETQSPALPSSAAPHSAPASRSSNSQSRTNTLTRTSPPCPPHSLSLIHI